MQHCTLVQMLGTQKDSRIPKRTNEKKKKRDVKQTGIAKEGGIRAKSRKKLCRKKTRQDILPKLYFYNIYLKTEVKNVLNVPKKFCILVSQGESLQAFNSLVVQPPHMQAEAM